MNVIIEEYIGEWQHTFSIIFSVYFIALLSFFFYTTRNKRLKGRERLREIKINSGEEVAKP
jgi:hypothetical protein